MVARNDGLFEVGAGMNAGLAAAIPGAAEGALLRPGGDNGAPWHTAWSQSQRHGWTVAPGYPDDAARTLLGNTLPATIAASSALLALGLVLAWHIGGAIARAVGALGAPAVALGRGEGPVLPPAAIREAAVVGDALRQVEAELVGYRGRLESLVDARTAELEQLNARVETVYATAPVGLCFVDRALRFVMINDYLAAINAVPARSHIGRTLPELLGEPGTAFEAPYRQVLETGRPLLDLEASGDVPARPGVMRHWLSSYYPVFGPGNELVGINAVVIDITERKLLEQQNRDNQEMFRVLFEASRDAQALLAYKANFVSANPAAAALFGYARVEDLLMLSPASASPPFQPCGTPTAELAAQYMRRALDEGGVQFEWVHQRADGSPFHADVKLSSLNIGGPGMMQVTMRDISARVAADAALRATSARLRRRERFIRTVTDNLPAPVSYWDADERLRFANRPLLEWMGHSEEEALGRSSDELVPERVRLPFAPYASGVMAGEPQRFECELRNAAGEPVHIWGNYLPDIDKDGRVRGSYKLHLDITDLKRTEDRLVQALREAETASRAKSEFLANMSHEIRTPMNAIVGLARLLQEAPLAPRERGHVAHIAAASKSLLGLLNDLLDYSRIESGRIGLEQVPFRLDATLQSIAILSAPGAGTRASSRSSPSRRACPPRCAATRAASSRSC
ncbi:PAS domain-containing protein [Massilia sp. Dwa41.01b]|uniref:PAS domain-containing protein n=1 Tax=Massilia sp. Dwa41.01b TaxID=2709302 RepID=UPI001603E18F|nr:PAS domain-containing protein [Massilia sp. Dwa41.01b]QNA88876.1 PAS domain-containing protein [Massilia sp. Dwa41.01b]